MSPLLIAVLVSAKSIRHWLYGLGGPGLFLLAQLDNSVIPTPGGLDVFTILLSSGRHDLWWYYAFMSTTGSILGAYITYRIGAKGGEQLLEKRVGKDRARKVYNKFEKAGFKTVLIGVLIPPPFPVAPILLAAGALNYPTKKFLTAIAIGRAIRFSADALLGIVFGRAILRFFAHYYKPALYTLIGLAIVGGIVGLIYYKRWRQSRQGVPPQPQAKVA
jgi:membrane protein DedA with SNARE-associated domain